jgi:serine O-acetyltransferase
MRLVRLLFRLYPVPLIGAIAKELLRILGADVPRSVSVPKSAVMPHRALGVVLHAKTVIGENVTIYQHVTVGNRRPGSLSATFGGVIIEDDVVLAAGCVVLGDREPLVVGRGTVVAANSVLLTSTGSWEVWAGNPARKVGDRPRS